MSTAQTFAQQLIGAIPSLRRSINSIVRTRTDLADDLMQVTLLRAWEKQDQFDGAHINAWLHTIARNSFISQQRRQITKNTTQAEDGQLEAIPDRRNTDERLEVAQALQLSKRLRPVDREIFNRLLWGHTLEEIAIATNKPVGSIKSAYSRLRVQMRKLSEGA